MVVPQSWHHRLPSQRTSRVLFAYLCNDFFFLCLLLEFLRSKPGPRHLKLDLANSSSTGQLKRQITVKSRERRFVQCGHTGKRNKGPSSQLPSLHSYKLILNFPAMSRLKSLLWTFSKSIFKKIYLLCKCKSLVTILYWQDLTLWPFFLSHTGWAYLVLVLLLVAVESSVTPIMGEKCNIKISDKHIYLPFYNYHNFNKNDTYITCIVKNISRKNIVTI